MKVTLPVAVITVLLMTLAVFARAEAPAVDPRQMVIDAVERMTERLEAEREALKTDPQLARSLVNEELDGLVDFRRITRMVMGPHFAEASNEQRLRFLDVFRTSLVNTYASGITLYEGQKIDTLPMREGDVRGDYARVRMQLNTNSGQAIPIAYTLHQRNGEWRVINVHVSGLDLGDTFRRQFAQVMAQHNGDLDALIANWSAGDAGIAEAAREAHQSDDEDGEVEGGE